MTNTADNAPPPRPLDEPRSARLSRVYREAVESVNTEPPRSVDDAVRAAARRAVQPRRPTIETAGLRSQFRRLRTPLALAATLLIAVSVALKVYNSGEMGIAPSGTPAARQNIQKEPDVNDKAEMPRAGEGAASKAGSLQREAEPPAGPANKASPGSAGQAAKTEMQAAREETHGTPQSFPSAPGPEPAAPRSQTPAEPAQPPASSSRSPRSNRTATKVEQEPAPAGAPQPRNEEQAEEGKAPALPPTMAPSLAKRLESRPPEVWIEEIRALKAAGRSAETTDLLAEFRKKFPNFALPEDLR